MTDKKLIEVLRNYAHSYTDGNPYDFNPGTALMIASRMEKLNALAENGLSAIDTNRRLSKQVVELQEKLDAAIEDMKLIMQTDEWCKFCKHYIPCEGKECNEYYEGRGCVDKNGNYIDWRWSCEDYNWGECPILENTPCNGCNLLNHWKWKGLTQQTN